MGHDAFSGVPFGLSLFYLYDLILTAVTLMFLRGAEERVGYAAFYVGVSMFALYSGLLGPDVAQ